MYTCYLWNSEPNVFVWCLICLFSSFYILLSLLMATFYIRNVQDKSKSCFVQTAPGKQQYVETKYRKQEGRSFYSYILSAILALLSLSGIIYYFFTTNYDLTTEEPTSILSSNRLLRILITIASFISMIFLSLVNSTADFFILPFYAKKEQKNPRHSEYFTDIESRFWCEILCLPLLFIVIAFNMLQLVLKVFFFLLFGITVWLARALQNMYVWMKSSDYNPMEILHYAYLSDN